LWFCGEPVSVMTDSRDARDVRLVAICGSLREESKTRIALRTALDAAADAGAETTLVDLREYDLPPIDADGRERLPATEHGGERPGVTVGEDRPGRTSSARSAVSPW